jgi:vacuolar-type H+-ATPase subunit F/Vma7
MKVVAIGDWMTVAACRAGGVAETIVCRDAAEAGDALTDVLSRPDAGVVFVQDRYLHEITLPPMERAYPVVIGIPGLDGPSRGEDAVSRAVRRVAGRHLPGGSA